jgi:hypothetical protein
VADLDPTLADLIAAAGRLADRKVEVQVEDGLVGPHLILTIDDADAGEGRLLLRRLEEYCRERRIAAEFSVVSSSPVRYVSKDPKPPTHWPPAP